MQTRQIDRSHLTKAKVSTRKALFPLVFTSCEEEMDRAEQPKGAPPPVDVDHPDLAGNRSAAPTLRQAIAAVPDIGTNSRFQGKSQNQENNEFYSRKETGLKCWEGRWNSLGRERRGRRDRIPSDNNPPLLAFTFDSNFY
ncbi:hypothetical protein BHE74_00025837 [Ensete ventricosum]|nr:hypothetical protein GW17_00020123 [Ensete ventricosum]RWW66779.1 hypothetical protein BHE74_00025837 [Ensete ventricosum]